ncbi:MAG: hypothetical protein INR66_00175 [Gordonia polyisoprenivorans]|nr:hypothetical protein [Gordonia polyisoprenivorans]
MSDVIITAATGGMQPNPCDCVTLSSAPWLLGISLTVSGIAAVAVVWAAFLYWMMWGYAAHNHNAPDAEHYRRSARIYARLGGLWGLIGGATLIGGLLVGFPAGDDTAWWAYGIVLAGVILGSALWFLGLPPRPHGLDQHDFDHTDISGFE